MGVKEEHSRLKEQHIHRGLNIMLNWRTNKGWWGKSKGGRRDTWGSECQPKEGWREDASWWQWWAPCEGPKDVSDMFSAVSERGQGTVGRDEGRARLKARGPVRSLLWESRGQTAKEKGASQARAMQRRPGQHRLGERLRQWLIRWAGEEEGWGKGWGRQNNDLPNIVHTLIPRTSDYVLFCGKGDFKDVIKLFNFEIHKVISLAYPRGPNLNPRAFFFFFNLYWICFNIASVLHFGFLATRHVGS